jgi:hypothetical protein
VVVAVVAALFAAGSAARPTVAEPLLPKATYHDESGDSKTAPDITKLVVTNTAPGRLKFELTLRTVKKLLGSNLIVFLDTDRNRRTGDSLGSDFGLQATEKGIAFASFDGEGSAEVTPSKPLSPRLKQGVLSFTLTLEDLGSPKSLGFTAVSGHGSDIDIMSAGAGPYVFPARPEIQRILVPFAALMPKAGTVFRPIGIDVVLAEGSPEAKIDLSLQLKVAGRVLTPLAGGKTWNIPLSLKGKTGSLKVTFSSGGFTLGSQTFPVLEIE